MEHYIIEKTISKSNLPMIIVRLNGQWHDFYTENAFRQYVTKGYLFKIIEISKSLEKKSNFFKNDSLQIF